MKKVHLSEAKVHSSSQSGTNAYKHGCKAYVCSYTIGVVERDRRSWCMDGLDCAVLAYQTHRLRFGVYAQIKPIPAGNVQGCLCV